MKTSVSESVLNKIAGLKPKSLLKKETSTGVIWCKFCGIFKNTFFTAHFRETVCGNGSRERCTYPKLVN